jgi:HPt (histidine-containing phosphotransfer) domain-containing protein
MRDADQSPMQSQIKALWQRNQPHILKRLATLEQAAAASDSGLLTPELKLEAAAIAHKLAGSLGMFGFHEGTRKARELEHYLEAPAIQSASLTTLTAELRQSLFPTS